MRFSDFIKANLSYLKATLPSRRPVLHDGGMLCDLHAHPYIHSRKTLIDTFDVMVRNNVSLLTLGTHGRGNAREYDFWEVKELMQKEGIKFEDKGIAFTVKHHGKTLTLIGGYEPPIHFKGIVGKIDILTLMPDPDFQLHLKKDMMFKDYLKLSRRHNGIVIGAHCYTIGDPEGRNGIIKFRLANSEDKKILKKSLFPFVDGLDTVSSNVLWMLRSNELIKEDYGKPLANSDAHSPSHHTRLEIGRSGNIMKLKPWKTGKDLRGQLRHIIKTKQFEPILNYTPPLQFFRAIAIEKEFGYHTR
ncbi:MAG: hypothetical protein KJ709_06175 [Nanoarchaeota archaeon]|nr:hypothetical protein [Nanoarchaeota archaeon]